MSTISETLQLRLSEALQKTGIWSELIPEVTATTDWRHGDYQTNTAILLGKRHQRNPREIAQQIVSALRVEDISPSPEIAGPGFINFRISPAFLNKRLLEMASDVRLGVAQVLQPKTIIIDFSSPNIAKPMHVGHIRSTFLGDTLARIARFLGHRVITDNHLGDWGTQFGKVIFGWKHHLDYKALAYDPIAELVRIYRIADSISKEDPGVLEKCREELVKLQNGDPENGEIWKKCVELSRQEFNKIYSLLGVNFDYELGESFYHRELPEIVQELETERLAERSDGAVVVWDSALSKDPFIIQKSDGGFGYAATDVATIRYRIRRWNPDAIWYVVGAPQQLHFRQLFGLARRMGYELELEHVSFGSILGEDKKLMRTRAGDSVPLRELLQESIERAGALLEGKSFEAPERLQISHTIGLGAVKYAELSQHRLTDYIFSWDKMLSFQGNTAPYLQNAYVRTQSIFRKLEAAFSLPDAIELIEPSELALAKRLLQFGDVVPSVLEGFKPNLLANFLYQLASEFHAFYESCPVLSADTGTRDSRLLLCQSFARVLAKGLEFLGIQVPAKM